jgi:hypothetical protein
LRGPFFGYFFGQAKSDNKKIGTIFYPSNKTHLMKKKPLNTDDKDRLDPMNDTRNYGAGREDGDILEREDEDDEMEEEPLVEDLDLPEDEEASDHYDEDEEG